MIKSLGASAGFVSRLAIFAWRGSFSREPIIYADGSHYLGQSLCSGTQCADGRGPLAKSSAAEKMAEHGAGKQIEVRRTKTPRERTSLSSA